MTCDHFNSMLVPEDRLVSLSINIDQHISRFIDALLVYIVPRSLSRDQKCRYTGLHETD